MRYLLFLLRAIYFRPPFFFGLAGLALLFVLGFFYPVLTGVARIASLLFALLLLGELFMLFSRDPGVKGERSTAEEWSNGDDNAVRIRVKNRYPWPARVRIIDEAPVELQLRDLSFRMNLEAGAEKGVEYTVTPRKRGRYAFGRLNVLSWILSGSLARRHRFPLEEEVRVLPAFKQMKRFEFMAVSDRLTEIGIRPIRRVGRSTEFERVRAYVQGDDRRAVNWKASARRTELMVNEYREERSQEVFSLIDTGRVMEMPFERMTLLDHSINASLVMSNIAMLKKDRPGLVGFSYKPHRFVPASSNALQMRRIMEQLYDLSPDFLETDMKALFMMLRRRVPQRSLLMLYTNIESKGSLERMRPVLQSMARFQTLLVILFRNTELEDFIEKEPEDSREVHEQTLAEAAILEKEDIAKELERGGIPVLLSRPERLTVNVVNKYLELKAGHRA